MSNARRSIAERSGHFIQRRAAVRDSGVAVRGQ
jgi:hypothetical protein